MNVRMQVKNHGDMAYSDISKAITCQYAVAKGFLNWFDDRAWYPLGRIVGGTVSYLVYKFTMSSNTQCESNIYVCLKLQARKYNFSIYCITIVEK